MKQMKNYLLLGDYSFIEITPEIERTFSFTPTNLQYYKGELVLSIIDESLIEVKKGVTYMDGSQVFKVKDEYLNRLEVIEVSKVIDILEEKGFQPKNEYDTFEEIRKRIRTILEKKESFLDITGLNFNKKEKDKYISIQIANRMYSRQPVFYRQMQDNKCTHHYNAESLFLLKELNLEETE